MFFGALHQRVPPRTFKDSLRVRNKKPFGAVHFISLLKTVFHHWSKALKQTLCRNLLETRVFPCQLGFQAELLKSPIFSFGFPFSKGTKQDPFRKLEPFIIPKREKTKTHIFKKVCNYCGKKKCRLDLIIIIYLSSV